MTDTAVPLAQAVTAALDALRPERGRPLVVKLGGSAADDPAALDSLLRDVVCLAELGLRPVVVHGGGKAIDRGMAAAGLTPVKVRGRRVTDPATLEVVVRVLTAEVNADVVARLRGRGGRAVPLHSGALQALHGEVLAETAEDGTPIDLGRVGRVTRVDRRLVEDFVAAGVVPVLPSLAHDPAGGWLNVNADDAAAAVAVQLGAGRVLFLSDTPGVLRDRADPASRIPRLTEAECGELTRAGVIGGGMVPKAGACLAALRGGVGRARMLDGRRPHALLAAALGGAGGTEVVAGP